ncbi:alpha/beta fold hydrolase [Streptomyces sp. DSM 44917]|uniref:Alpha/beta fold hydrolase n=1 Tax=Streptomyces boetiae TaxID=3075541 RepID=A0ABU2LDL6_9ACTN|nr:alpha/beta fold hydrolase [Streptomyces sp. DSM 44917]MDT0309597.1 alpha/beta fold hydrolase [Streptomyces sp. DSM 44917]
MRKASPRHRQRRLLRRWAGAAVAALAVAATAFVALPAAQAGQETQPQQEERYAVGDVNLGLRNYLLSPGAVTGANDWECEPSAEHPEPVVLVHATAFNLGSNFARLAPTLANEGRCVYAFNYGMGSFSMFGRVGGLTGITRSSQALDAFVDRVLTSTGAEQVDILGHSQGGMLPNHYIKRLGGAALVDDFVALAPSNHGTTLSGLTTIGETLGFLGLANGFLDLAGLDGLLDQEVGSEFQEALFADGDTVPGVDYTVIATRHDAIVTPYTQAFLEGENVTNILLQDVCPQDEAGHMGLAYDTPTVQMVLNALGADDPDFRPDCEGYGPGW